MGKLPDVVDLSDDEPPAKRARGEAASSSTLPPVVALSDDEPCSAAKKSDSVAPRPKPGRHLTYKERHAIKIQLERFVTQNCSCANGGCMRSLSGKVAELLELRVRIKQLEKRDADALVLHSDVMCKTCISHRAAVLGLWGF